MSNWNCDVFETPHGNGVRPPDPLRERIAASRDRNFRRRVARRLAKINWRSVREWYGRAQIHSIMRPGLGGYTGPVPKG
jgi:hypothetical protein